MIRRNKLYEPNQGRLQTRKLPFLLPALASALSSSIFLLVAAPVYAVENTEELQAEIAQLKEKNEALSKALDGVLGRSVSDTSAPIAEAETQIKTQPKPEHLTNQNPSGQDEVVIFAARTYSPEVLKDVPLSISVVTGEELKSFNTADFRNILTRIGNVRATYTNPQAGSLIIRGVGWATGAGPLDPSVGVKVDGVSYGISGLASSLNYIDVATVDVTRGPQGTLGGKNTSMGEVTITSHIPEFTPEASASITYGQLNTISSQLSVGGPVIDDLLAWRGTFLREQADGPFKNINDPNYSYKNTDRTFGRVQFLLTPSSDFSALLNLEYSPVSKEISDNYVNFTRPTPANYDSIDPATGKPFPVDQSNEPGGKLSRRWFLQEPNYSTDNYFSDEINRLSQNPNNYGSEGAALTLNWSPADYTFTSISAYREFYFDSGGGPISVFDIDRSPSTGHVEYDQVSQELRVNSPIGGVFDYEAGLYYFHSKMPERWTTARFGSDAGAYYASTTQYTSLDSTGDGRGLLQNSLDRLFTKTKDEIFSTSHAIYANANWHFTDALKLNIGLRATHEERETRSSRFIVDEGFGAELNPSSLNNVQLGGFNSSGTGALGTNTAEQLQLANAAAKKYFGAADYASLTATQKQQVGHAKAIRQARIGGVYLPVDAEPFDEWLPTAILSPSYQINPDQTAYLSWQHGEKAGISQIIGATTQGGKSALTDEEKSNTYELGLKSSLLDGTLVVNTDVFVHKVKNYLQPVYYYDEAQTEFNKNGLLAYSPGLGNVPEVESKGLELDVVYTAIPYTSLRFAGAYTDATYKEFRFLAKPLELGGTKEPYYDVTGKTLPGSAKVTFNLSADFSRPIFADKQFHSNINYRYSSEYNNDLSLSRYAKVDAVGIADFAIGIGQRDGSFDVNVIVKNLFDTDYGFLGNWNNYFPSNPRWVGVALSAKL